MRERCWDRCLFILLLLGEVGDNDAVVVVESLAVVAVEVEASTGAVVEEDPLFWGALLPLENDESIVCVWRRRGRRNYYFESFDHSQRRRGSSRHLL